MRVVGNQDEPGGWNQDLILHGRLVKVRKYGSDLGSVRCMSQT